MVEKLGENAADAAPDAQLLWVPIRADYEAGALTRNAICRKYGIDLPRLLERATTSKWVRADSDVLDRRILINQLLALLELQINQLEITMTNAGEKEVAVLAKLSAGLEKLIAMDKAEAASRTTEQTETREIQDIRIKLAKRIDALTKG